MTTKKKPKPPEPPVTPPSDLWRVVWEQRYIGADEPYFSVSFHESSDDAIETFRRAARYSMGSQSFHTVHRLSPRGQWERYDFVEVSAHFEKAVP